MPDTTTISVEQSTKETLEAAKPDGMTWDTYLQRVSGNAEAVQIHPDSVSDIADVTASKVAERLESRFR